MVALGDVYQNLYEGTVQTDLGHIVIGILALLGVVWIWEQYQKHKKEKAESAELEETTKKYFGPEDSA